MNIVSCNHSDGLCHGHSFKLLPLAFSIDSTISNDSPNGIPYPTLKPYGFDGVLQSICASFRNALSTSTDVKNAIDRGKSSKPILWQENNSLTPEKHCKTLLNYVHSPAHTKRPHQQICQVHSQCRLIRMFLFHNVSHFVVKTQAKSNIIFH